MRRRSTAFFLGDVSFLADPKFRALERRLPDPDDFNSAVGAFFVALAAARRNGHPDLDVRAETSSRFVEDLRAVGLLNGAGFHGSSFDAWAPMTRQQAFAGQVRAESATRDATGRFVPASSSVDQRTPAAQRAGTAGPSLENAGPAYPLPSIPSTEEGVQGEKPDALDAYYRLTTRYPKGAALSWLRQLVDRHGDERVSTALSFAWIDSTELSTLLSRTEALMASADETEAKVRRNEASARQLAQLRESEMAMTEEQRAANLARLHDDMAARGLV